MRSASVRPVGMVNGLRSSRSGELLVPVSRPSLLGLLLINLARVVGRLVVGAFRHPIAVLFLAAAVAVLRSRGPLGLAIVTGVSLAGLVAWWRLHAASFRRVVVSQFRAAFVYARMWQPAMVTCGLDTRMGGVEYLPRVRRVVSTRYVDRVLVKILPGQSPEQYENATNQLAHTFSSMRCRVVLDRPGRLWLEFTHGDPLAEVVPAIAPPAEMDLAALPIGRTEAGGHWKLRLLGNHVLVAGATGSGKGSVVASMLRAMGPGIRDGSVEVWAIDPKGGMELTPSSGLFSRFVYDSPASMVQLLEEAVSYMRFRAERLRLEGQRVHVPSPGDPLVVVVVDEMAALTAYIGDRDLKRRAESALQLLLSQGRAPGVLVVAAVQDPGKDVVGFRDLFPSRIALRLLEDVQVDMVLGRAARLRGAACDQIPSSLPGVGYVVLEGVREPVRVRAAYMSDEDVRDTVGRFTRDHFSDVVQVEESIEGRG